MAVEMPTIIPIADIIAPIIAQPSAAPRRLTASTPKTTTQMAATNMITQIVAPLITNAQVALRIYIHY
jgi:hypothetical protein